MSNHMNFEERVLIQQGLDEGRNYSEIARQLNRNRSTISREVNARKSLFPSVRNDCVHRRECISPALCRNKVCDRPASCGTACRKCREGCPEYEQVHCTKILEIGNLCNYCSVNSCLYQRILYDAKTAQKKYEEELSESRRGICLTESELEYVDRIVSRRIMQGFSVPVICMELADVLPVSERTIYSYIDMGLLGVSNLELRRKVQRRQRKKTGPVLRVDKKCHIGRTYEEYLEYMEKHPDECVCQMDSVMGGDESRKVLLTIFFTNCDLQLAFLRRRNTAASVSAVFRLLRRKLGDEKFKELFPVLLSDRGSEFTDPTKIEVDQLTGEEQCRLFYCDPQNSNQKAGCERNHEFIRYVIPKGKSMDALTQEDITKMMNHINSYPRKKWKGRSPIDLFTQIYGKETSTLLGLKKIDPDSIILRPELLKK